MGCDIHIVVEQRDRARDRWVGVQTIGAKGYPKILTYENRKIVYKALLPAARTRNYDLFAEIAGVRGPGPEPRGLPDDASDTTLLLADEIDLDGHSHSWLPLKDAVKAWNKHDPREERNDEGSPLTLRAYDLFGVSVDDDEDWDDFRVVFWFDN